MYKYGFNLVVSRINRDKIFLEYLMMVQHFCSYDEIRVKFQCQNAGVL